MKRAANLVGTLLVAFGVALFVVVGVLYVRQRMQQPSAAGWNAAEQAKGRQIAAQLARKHKNSQKIAIPKSLSKNKLPAAGSEIPVRLVIPSIDVNAPIVQTPPVNGIWQVADWAVGHLATTPNPGANGNMAFSAHDDIKGEIFKRLGELHPGAQMYVYTAHSRYTYVVVRQLLVDPSDVSVLNPTARPTVTLISCAPYWVDTQRVIIQGLLRSRAAA